MQGRAAWPRNSRYNYAQHWEIVTRLHMRNPVSEGLVRFFSWQVGWWPGACVDQVGTVKDAQQVSEPCASTLVRKGLGC